MTKKNGAAEAAKVLGEAEREARMRQISAKAGAYSVLYEVTKRWHVERKKDKQVMVDGLTNRDEAEKWLFAHASKEAGQDPAPLAQSREVPVIPRASYSLLEYTNHDWSVRLPAEATAEDLGNVALYGNARVETRAFDVLRVHNDRIWGEVLVTQVLEGRIVLVQPLRVVDREPLVEDASDQVPSGYEFTYDEVDLWSITRKSDGACMGKRLLTKKDAVRHLQDHAAVRGVQAPVYV